MKVNRREAITVGGGLCLGAAFTNLLARPALDQIFGSGSDHILDVPAGFDVQVIDRSGNHMTDGYNVPGRPDGMACFSGEDGKLILMRNHEVSRWDYLQGPYNLRRPPSKNAYDKVGCGGVTRLVIDPQRKIVVSRNLVLEGTARNCAGGTSPWGWLSCEETVEKGHGYVFLCDPNATMVQPPRPIFGYGRFNHEAATVHPRTLIAYLTEDQDDSCFYRFVPHDPKTPFEGKLQAMAITGAPKFNTSLGMAGQKPLAVEWIDIENPNPSEDSIRFEAREKGAAVIARGEGLWLASDHIYFTSTTGGQLGKGQIFRLGPDIGSGKEVLNLIVESMNVDDLDMPDNITVTTWGDLFVSEDGPSGNCIRMVKPNGEISLFARNIHSGSELAGLCFDPSGSILFLNIQSDGLTVMITGPFKQWADGSGRV